MHYNTFVLVIIAIVLIACLFHLIRSIIELNRFKTLPGPRPRLPFIGNALAFYRTGVPLKQLLNIALSEMAEKYKKEGFVVLCFLAKCTVFLFKPEYSEEFLKHNKIFNKPDAYNVAKCLLGSNVGTVSGVIWKNKRRLLNPSFHSNILDEYITGMNLESFKLTSRLFDASVNGLIDIRPLMNETAFNIIAKTAMAINLDQNSAELQMFRKCFCRLVETLTTRFYNPLDWFDFIFYRRNIGKLIKKDIEFIRIVTEKIINERRIELQSRLQFSTTKQKVFIDYLLDQQSKDESITDEDIIDEVAALFFAGHETVTYGLTCALFLLGKYESRESILNPKFSAKNDECQEKVIKEINSIFGNNKKRNINKDDLRQMQYTECVIKETLRLYPPLPIIGRLTCNDIKIGEHTIPEGTSVFVSITHIQRNEAVFSNASDFIPERFENPSQIQTGFMPFALGMRNCIGQRFAMMEMKIVIANIFRNFTIRSMDTQCEIDATNNLAVDSVAPIPIIFKSVD